MLRRIWIFLGAVSVLTPIAGQRGSALAWYAERLDVTPVKVTLTSHWWLSPGQLMVISLCLGALCAVAGWQRCVAAMAGEKRPARSML